MKRLVVMTVGKTHSGKTTFARALEKGMQNSVVIDRDSHAEFLNTYYRPLLPKQGTNTIKNALTKMIVDFAVNETDCHLILCNSYRSQKDRLNLLGSFRSKEFTTVIVNFEIPDTVLTERIANSDRSKMILRTASSFEEVLKRQQEETNKGDVRIPIEGEAEHLFVIQSSGDVPTVIRKIIHLAKS